MANNTNYVWQITKIPGGGKYQFQEKFDIYYSKILSETLSARVWQITQKRCGKQQKSLVWQIILTKKVMACIAYLY